MKLVDNLTLSCFDYCCTMCGRRRAFFAADDGKGGDIESGKGRRKLPNE